MTIFNGITDTIGRTPVIRLKRVAPEGVNLYGMCPHESYYCRIGIRFGLLLGLGLGTVCHGNGNVLRN